MMKKVVIFYKNYQKYGGQEKVIWNLSHYLAENNYLVSVYAAKIKDAPTHPNINAKKVFIPNLGIGIKTLIFALYAYKKAKKIEDAIVFGFGKTFYQDIYSSGGGVHKYYFQRAKLKHKTKVKKVFYTVKKLLCLSHWVNVWIENKTYKDSRLKAIVVPSEFVKKQILSVFRGVDENKIKIIRNDVTIERFDYNRKDKVGKEMKNRLGLNSFEIIFSFVSTNHRLKGLEYLLDACRILKTEGYRFKLIVAGDGNHSYFKKIVKNYDLEENVECLGIVKDIENIYYASDFLVYPTLFDTFGLVVLEAMACGTPVLCSRYAGAAEIIEDVNFIIENPQDPKEIAKKMIYVAKHKEKWLAWQKSALKTAKQYSTNSSSEKIRKLIEELYQ